ncbi:MAG: hypothetical protein EZS28_034983 [Streblomastix strix]|uniref:Uncharacterized protein n=1 Tax=Streblomastix strix TaxID=222440 RepID=A0A5J4UHC7_9EUKA|nr:MAG: hypothetical protein EZS28_034983 [Streblomastix strix]
MSPSLQRYLFELVSKQLMIATNSPGDNCNTFLFALGPLINICFDLPNRDVLLQGFIYNSHQNCAVFLETIISSSIISQYARWRHLPKRGIGGFMIGVSPFLGIVNACLAIEL